MTMVICLIIYNGIVLLWKICPKHSEKNGLGFTGMSLLDNEIELAKSRDTKEDRDKAIEKIHDEYMIFW